MHGCNKVTSLDFAGVGTIQREWIANGVAWLEVEVGPNRYTVRANRCFLWRD